MFLLNEFLDFYALPCLPAGESTGAHGWLSSGPSQRSLAKAEMGWVCCQGNMGARLKESVAINSSLMTLGRCLEALRWNQQHPQQEPRLVPYRESKARSVAFSFASQTLYRQCMGLSLHLGFQTLAVQPI